MRSCYVNADIPGLETPIWSPQRQSSANKRKTGCGDWILRLLLFRRIASAAVHFSRLLQEPGLQPCATAASRCSLLATFHRLKCPLQIGFSQAFALLRAQHTSV